MLVATTAVMIAVAGCGEDDSSASKDVVVTMSSLSKAQFVRRAKKLCTRQSEDVLSEASTFLKRRRADAGEMPPPRLQAELAKAVLLPTIEAKVETIRRLGAPAGDEEEIKAMLAAQQEGIDELREAEAIDPKTDVEGYFVEATELLREYGLAECGFSP